MANPRQTTKFKEEKLEKASREKKEERIGATFLRQDTVEESQKTKAEPVAVDLKRNEKSHITIESDNQSDAETVIIDQNGEEKIEPEEEKKSMEPMKIETGFKKEEEIPKPQDNRKRDITWVLSDNEDDDLMITGGNSRKRMKLESDDLKGNFSFNFMRRKNSNFLLNLKVFSLKPK